MSGRAARRGVFALLAAALAFGAPAQANDAAHRMAEKFAGAAKNEADKPAADTTASEAEKRKAAEAKAQAHAQAQAKARQDKARLDKAKADKAKAEKAAAEAKQRAAAKAAQAARAEKAAREAHMAAEAQRRADEADMLARARLEAEERAASAEHTRLAEEARRLIEEAERATAKAEAMLAGQGREPAAKPAPDDAQEAARRAEAERAETARAEAEQQARIEQARIEQARAEQAQADAEAMLVRQRADETRRLAEKLKRVREIRAARLDAQARREAEAARTAATSPPPAAPPAPPEMREEPARVAAPAVPPPPPASTGPAEGPAAVAPTAPPARIAAAPAPPPVPPTEAAPAMPSAAPPPAPPSAIEVAAGLRETRVAVLLILAPGNYGIRRSGPKTADPLVCTHEGCYVSTGPDQPARFLPRRKALGFGNTIGGRAGACRQSLSCVFRGVEIGQVPGYLQPVDLHILKHDRRLGQVVTGDSGCFAHAGRLSCSRSIRADDYVMWVVPESVAERAGPAALLRALADGLDTPRSASLAPGR